MADKIEKSSKPTTTLDIAPAIIKSEEKVEKLLSLDRVVRVVKGGRRFRFRATVVVGDKNGQVGLGISKGKDVATAISMASQRAWRNTMVVDIFDNHTIKHEIYGKLGSARVMLKPASQGTGVIAGGAVRSVLEVCGIKDVLTKALGSNNTLNNALATLDALRHFKLPDPDPYDFDQKEEA